MRLKCLVVLGCILVALPTVAEPQIVDVLEVSKVWSAHPVGFYMLTQAPYQFVAYYDAERNMTVASRKLDESEWTYKVLPEKLGWDSHNSITMTIDDEGYIHLSGNMHVSHLKYFRTEKPMDITTFKRHKSMVGKDELRVTYPKFFRGASNELIFTYRDGGSGSGNQLYNVYDLKTQEWKRLFDTPLTDGEGKMNAYICGPSKGPDGYFHLCWVWRDTPDCATNHDLSYARSKDLVHWENSRGEAVPVPMTLDTAEIVDPVPVGGGIINSNLCLGFDAKKRPVLTYHKYDDAGNTQLFNARLEEDSWKIYQSSNWSYRWAFSGGGSIGRDVAVQPVRVDGEGKLIQGWKHVQEGEQLWRLDNDTMKPVEQLPIPKSDILPELNKVESAFPNMRPQIRSNSGPDGTRYYLRWETLGQNRDKPIEKPWPEPSSLRLYVVK